MKTLSFELSKRLNELGLLNNIESDYIYRIYDKKLMTIKDICKGEKLERFIKTLTLEEAIEFLTDNIGKVKIETLKVGMYTNDKHYRIGLNNKEYTGTNYIDTKTLIEGIEKALEYLLDNK